MANKGLAETAHEIAMSLLEPGGIEPGDFTTFRERVVQSVVRCPEKEKAMVVAMAEGVAKMFWDIEEDFTE